VPVSLTANTNLADRELLSCGLNATQTESRKGGAIPGNVNHSRAENTLGEEAVYENCCSNATTFQLKINSFLTCIYCLPAMCLILLFALLFLKC